MAASRPRAGDEALPPIAIDDLEVSTERAARLTGSGDVDTRTNAAAVVQRRAVEVERLLLAELAEASKAPSRESTSRYHTLAATVGQLRISGAVPLLLPQATLDIDSRDDPVAYTGDLHRTANALVDIGGRPVIDGILERLRRGPQPPDLPRPKFTPLPDEDVYVLTWILAQVMGRTPARGAVAAVVEEARERNPNYEIRGELAHLLLAQRILDPRHRLRLRGIGTPLLAGQVKRVLEDTDDAAEDAAEGE